MNWFESIPEKLRLKLEEYIKRGIEMSNIYERNGGGIQSQGYLNSKIEACDKIAGFCSALFLMNIIENPIMVSINDGSAEFRKMDKDFTIKGTPEVIFVYKES